MNPEFISFPKIARLSREMIITEKIDGSNSCIRISNDGTTIAGSRERWITEEDDNYGFAKWVRENKEDLLKLGPGTHFGEWWGYNIGREYDLKDRVFSLFNISRWSNENSRPKCCRIIPVIYTGLFDTKIALDCIEDLKKNGSYAAPGFMRPEGIIVWHTTGNVGFKKTILKDNIPKSKV